MGSIKGKKYEAEAAAKTFVVSVQQREGEGKVNGFSNVYDLDDAYEM